MKQIDRKTLIRAQIEAHNLADEVSVAFLLDAYEFAMSDQHAENVTRHFRKLADLLGYTVTEKEAVE